MALRESLQGKVRPSRTFPLRVTDDTEATQALLDAEQSGDEERIKVARRGVEACYEWLKIVALTPAEWEELVRAHPPTPAQVKADQAAWVNEDTFGQALLAACIEGEETAEDWDEFLRTGPVSPGETGDLVQAVWAINDRSPGPYLGKGSTLTDS